MVPSKELVRELEPKVTIVEVPVEVPVIREKVVTKVVYRKERRRDSQTPRDLSGSTYAKSQKAPGLEGFEPLNEVKATIIKGGTPDEK